VAPLKSLRKYLTEQFGCFITDEGGDTDVEIGFVDRLCSRDLVYISNLACFNRETFFLIDRYGNKASLPFDTLTGDWCKVVAEKSIDPGFFYRSILQCLIRYRFLQHNIAYVHASAVQYKGAGLLFPGWGGIGKTDLLMMFMDEGARYISDDRVLISSEGRMLIHNTALNLLHYNYKGSTRLRERLGWQKRGLYLANRLIRGLSQVCLELNSRRSFLTKTVSAIRDLSDKSLWTEVDVQRIFPESEISMQTPLSKVFFISRVSEGHLRSRPISGVELARRMSACLRGDLNKMERAYQMFLFAFPYKDNSLVQGAPVRELKIMEEAFSGKEIHNILVPEGTDSKKVYDTLKLLI